MFRVSGFAHLGLLALAVGSLFACSPVASAPASPSVSPDSCGSEGTHLGGYLYGGVLGVQEGIVSRIRAGQPPLKIMWANNAAAAPREMTISARNTDASASEIVLSAGWAATPSQSTFPSSRPVTGYVSEIPTLPTGGCWTFRWTAGGAQDALTVRVPDR